MEDFTMKYTAPVAELVALETVSVILASGVNTCPTQTTPDRD